MKKLIIVFLLVVFLMPIFAHEYILIARNYKVTKGDSLEMHLFVADGFNIELERPLQTSITKKFELLSEIGRTDLLSIIKNGALPIVNIKVGFEGLGLLHMERDFAKNVLPTDKFLEYLKEDHIENITLRDDSLKQNQTERFTRYVKALVLSGAVRKDTLFKTITGQKFEIVLLQNPYLLGVGDVLKARVLFMGKPLCNKIITARNRLGNKSAIALTSRTNNDGICSFPIQRKGDWFIHATHMIASTDKTEADWESFWTSYSFGIDR